MNQVIAEREGLMRRLIVSILLLALTPAAHPAQLKRWASGTLSLTISLSSAKIPEGEPIPVTVVFKNTGKARANFVLPYNDRDPPGFILARLRDTKGALLTENTSHREGWWTSWVMRSDLYKENKKDRILLNPGQEYTRPVNLKALLAGCKCLPDGIPAGRYRVQFALGNIISNEVELTIGE